MLWGFGDISPYFRPSPLNNVHQAEEELRVCDS